LEPLVTTTSSAATPVADEAVRLERVTKRYGAVVACDAVDLTLRRGAIHGVLGENGAGKSTLMKILIGLVTPDGGRVHIHGQQCDIDDPATAAKLGIGMVHQHFSLVDPLTVWENVALGEEARLRPAQVRTRVAEISEKYGLGIDPDATVGDLTPGLRQRVEIIKCLRRDPSIVIFDEPTSVLTPEESAQLFTTLRRVVADEGRAVALVSHKLDEVLHATDEITIMRSGRVVDRTPTAGTTPSDLAKAMVGRSVSLRSERAAFGAVAATDTVTLEEVAAPDGPVVLTVTESRLRGRDGDIKLDGLSVRVRAGEILGVAGVEGNGQDELVEVLSSLARLDSGEVTVSGSPVVTGRAGAMAAAGVAVIPADRHDSGVVLDMSIAENLVLVEPSQVAARGLMDPGRMRAHATRLIDEYEIACPGPDAPMWSLSGGNQQRVVLARELSCEPVVLVAAQPTRGLDVGAIEFMGSQIRAAAERGVAVLLISSELEELLELSHRIIVLSDGQIAGEMQRDEVDMDRLGLLMGGSAA